MLRVLDINVSFFNAQFAKYHPNHLIVSNHLSYLDVLILASQYPSCFVTSKEVQATPFLGQLASLAGCLFVDRKNRKNLPNEIKELRDALKGGLNVIVFPEATSTNGDEVIRFRRPLFEAAVASGKPILPLTINYKSISNSEVTHMNRDLLCWYGEMDFFPHLWELLSQKKIEIEVTLSEPFLPEFMPVMDLALKSHQKVSHSFSPFKPEAMEAM